jgi:dTDP-4-amino-4,6-dideoxygalactose transaminase
MKIPFNKPFFSGDELAYINDAVSSGKISGNGKYTRLCQNFFEKKYGFKKVLLTNSCTDALEMAAILLDIKKGDEVIMPSYTFASTANAFLLRGAKIIFCDSKENHPNINEDLIESLITDKTRVIVPVHYAGISCDMNKIMSIALKYNLFVVEDAAQSIDNFFIDKNNFLKSVGSLGHLSTFSFHESKNIISGEGGMLVVNKESLIKRSEVIWEKGTNRAAFFRGEVDRYSWRDIGSSFLPSELNAAFLWAQLNNIREIQNKRKVIWNRYLSSFKPLKNLVKFNHVPQHSTNNYHIFFLICNGLNQRNALLKHLKSKGIIATFHYQSLHNSSFYFDKHDGRILPNTDIFSNCLVRLPIFFNLKKNNQLLIIHHVINFFKNKI